MLPLGVDRRRNQNPEYNWKIRIQSENPNTIGISEYNQKIRMQSETQNTIGKIEQHIRKSKQVKHKNTKI